MYDHLSLVENNKKLLPNKNFYQKPSKDINNDEIKPKTTAKTLGAK